MQHSPMAKFASSMVNMLVSVVVAVATAYAFGEWLDIPAFPRAMLGVVLYFHVLRCAPKLGE